VPEKPKAQPTAETPKVRLLQPPPATSVRYDRNFIRTAVCELRFPTLLELETNPPRAFQKAIRKDFPFYQAQIVDQVVGPEITREQRYLFRSKDQHWTVQVKSFAIALETAKYVDFDDFLRRFKKVMQSAKDFIDTDFLTRVGLRYINWIPVEDGDPKGWLVPDLALPTTGEVLGTLQQFVGSIRGPMEQGNYMLRYALKEDDEKKAVQLMNYVLDFDYYAENVELTAVESLVKHFNKTNFSLFKWCLGEKAKKVLGEGRPK
jgi:uncharacterized protein (TIGR04255 family)